MPSPSSQNFRSAPQKQPSPNTTCSRPSGYGGCKARPLTKWRVAVGIGVARPGNASFALGSAVVLRMKNMDYLQAGLGGILAGVQTAQRRDIYICLYGRLGSPVTAGGGPASSRGER